MSLGRTGATKEATHGEPLLRVVDTTSRPSIHTASNRQLRSASYDEAAADETGLQHSKVVQDHERDGLLTESELQPEIWTQSSRKSSSRDSELESGDWVENLSILSTNHGRRTTYNRDQATPSVPDFWPPALTEPTPKTNQRSKHRRKVDLSEHDVRRREASHTKAGVSQGSPPFRANSGLRRILASFLEKFPGQSTEALLLSYQTATNDHFAEVFTPENLRVLERNKYDRTHVLSWAWVLSADTPHLQVRRYVLFGQRCRVSGRAYPPAFVVLQLLRSDHIDAGSLRLLWREIVISLEGESPVTTLDDDSAAILLIRVLRHARMVDVGMYEEIAGFAPILLQQSNESDIKHRQRLTHFYNRFLSLMALPTPYRPFRSVPIQQRAQLKMARFMQETSPPIAVNREGYRAFTKLQLMHTKTADEQNWARVKALSWPPWRRDQLGIQEGLDYPGQQSRAMKVLQRMRESGYGPSSFEDGAQVLAGWDTDRSPTIQVRRIVGGRPMSWVRGSSSQQEMLTEPGIWAARVEATRSVREAWLCFYSYTEATPAGDRKLIVYQAMFNKLFAKRAPDRELQALPGDGQEVYLDPISTRDLVYVPTEPPSVDELYSQMLADGIRPAGRLLTKLVTHALTVEQGCQYLKQSTLSEKCEVLLHAEKYPREVIRATLGQLPDHCFCGVITSLSSARHLGERVFQPPGSLSTDALVIHRAGSLLADEAADRKRLYRSESSLIDADAPIPRVSSFTYAQQLLEISATKYLPAYHAVLSGVRRRSGLLRRNTGGVSSPTASTIWSTTMRCLTLMQRQSVPPNTSTLLQLNPIVQRVCSYQSQDELLMSREMLAVVWSVFCHALQGKTVGDWSTAPRRRLEQYPATSISSILLPTCKELESLFITLAVLGDVDGATELLEWVAGGSTTTMFTEARPPAVRNMLVAIRLAFERLHRNNTIDMDRTMELCHIGWARDDEVEEFLGRKKDLRAMLDM